MGLRNCPASWDGPQYWTKWQRCWVLEGTDHEALNTDRPCLDPWSHTSLPVKSSFPCASLQGKKVWPEGSPPGSVSLLDFICDFWHMGNRNEPWEIEPLLYCTDHCSYKFEPQHGHQDNATLKLLGKVAVWDSWGPPPTPVLLCALRAFLGKFPSAWATEIS